MRLVSKEEGLVPQDGRDSPHILMAKVLCHFLAIHADASVATNFQDIGL